MLCSYAANKLGESTPQLLLRTLLDNVSQEIKPQIIDKIESSNLHQIIKEEVIKPTKDSIAEKIIKEKSYKGLPDKIYDSFKSAVQTYPQPGNKEQAKDKFYRDVEDIIGKRVYKGAFGQNVVINPKDIKGVIDETFDALYARHQMKEERAVSKGDAIKDIADIINKVIDAIAAIVGKGTSLGIAKDSTSQIVGHHVDRFMNESAKTSGQEVQH